MTNLTVNIRTADLVVAILLIVISVFAGYVTTTWLPPVLPGDPGAAFFPRIALAVVLLFSLVLLVQSATKFRLTEADQSALTVTIDLGQFIITIVLSGLMVAGLGYVGFEVSAFAFLIVLLGMRTSRWLWSVVVSAISVAIMYLVFVIALQVRLPLTFLPYHLDFF
ncbi:MAG: tripartite tricarboxylate transporter TctB family protein [Hyphomicrobiaceae bacterium]